MLQCFAALKQVAEEIFGQLNIDFSDCGVIKIQTRGRYNSPQSIQTFFNDPR